MLLRPSSFMPFCTRVSSRCVPEGVAPSLDRGDEEGQGETQGGEETNLLAPVLECLRHHRIGQHGQERAAGEGLDEGDRFSAAAKRDRASTSPPRARTMRPRRSPDPWPHHPLERVWCSIRSGLLLRWLELHISRLRPRHLGTILSTNFGASVKPRVSDPACAADECVQWICSTNL
jgi:hypothetical protein